MSNFDENKISRQASGTSAGGQFANKERPANDSIGLGGAVEETDYHQMVESVKEKRYHLQSAINPLSKASSQLMKQEIAALTRSYFPNAKTVAIEQGEDDDGFYIDSIYVENQDGSIHKSAGRDSPADNLEYDIASAIDWGSPWEAATDTEYLNIDVAENLPSGSDKPSDHLRELAGALSRDERSEMLRILQEEQIKEQAMVIDAHSSDVPSWPLGVPDPKNVEFTNGYREGTLDLEIQYGVGSEDKVTITQGPLEDQYNVMWGTEYMAEPRTRTLTDAQANAVADYASVVYQRGSALAGEQTSGLVERHSTALRDFATGKPLGAP
jgi:hypothetical protein